MYLNHAVRLVSVADVIISVSKCLFNIFSKNFPLAGNKLLQVLLTYRKKLHTIIDNFQCFLIFGGILWNNPYLKKYMKL